MVNENWLKVRAIFDEALRRPPAERHQFIHDSCDGEQTLMAEVESLLSSLDRADSFMETPAIAKVAEAMDADTHQLQPGKSFGHYEIIRLIGKGGMGEVYLAQDTNLGRKVALKLLPAEFTQDAERVRRFMQEARAASLLNHPNILTIHEIGQIDQRHFIVSEFVEGETLRQQLARGPLDLQAALEVAVQVASALAAAHQAGIVHRDIKPENIVLRPDGLLKVLDFGLAKLSRKDEGGGLKDEASTLLQPHPSTFSPPPSTIPGIVMGTPRYMSPEQARGMKLDHRTDIFSLGVLLYEMLAGRRPFEGATISDVIAALLTTEPSPLREHCATASAELERIVGKCLAKECEARYQSAEELSAELKTLPTNKQAQEVAVTQELESSGVKFASRRWIVVAALAALLMVGLVWFLVGRRAPAMLSDPIESLAVLPPRPLQINGRDEALELGTTSTLITRLGSLRQLIVRPESAVGRYTRHDQDPLAAGREQKVDAVLDTRYQRSGDKIRFRLRLLRVADGATLWSDTLDQQTADPFAIEDALSAKVTGGLKLTLSEAEKELLAKRYTNSSEAWQLYARGRQLVHTRQIPDIEKAIAYFERAIALDPEFALAHVKLGHAYASLNFLGNSPAGEVAPKAKAAYDRALKLDGQLAEAHAFLAQYKEYYEWDFSGAEHEFKRALDLNPNSPDAHHVYAFYLTYKGRFEQALTEIRRAEELDPTDGFILRNVAQSLYFARRYDEAIEQLQQANDLHPNYQIFKWMIRAYKMKGDEQAAQAVCLKQAEARRAGADEIAKLKAAFAAEGLKGYWRMELDRLLEQEKHKYVEQYNIALHYVLLGEKEEALARLQRAVEDRNLYVTSLNIEPLWDSYRTDPRFVAMVRRVGLAP